MLCVEGAHLFDESYKRLERLVFCWEDDWCVDSTSREIASKDLQNLFAYVDGDILLSLDC